MGYSDQKFYDRPQMVATVSNVATGTITASGTNTLANAIPLNGYIRRKQINKIRSLVITAPVAAIGNTVVLYFLQGTNTFGTLTASNSVGGYQDATFGAPTVTTNTFTNTLPNGSTVVTSNTTTTTYSQFAANGQPTVTVVAVGTASGQNWGAYQIEFEEQELPS